MAAKFNVWLDEASTLHTTGFGARYALHSALFFEQQAPLYFVLLSVWRHFDHSIFFTRLFSVICIALTVYVASSLWRRFDGTVSPGWFTAVVALSPVAIWTAVEIRLYAFVILLSGLWLLTFYDAYIAQNPEASVRGLRRRRG